MSAHGTPWRPLGVLLVEQGVISETELETALADQAATGKPLGEILIAHGFSSRPAIQDALAEQSGVMFEPERGFGTGLRGLLARKHRQRKESDAPSRPQLAVVPSLASVEVEVESQPRRMAAGAAPAEARAPGVNLLRSVELPQPAPPPPPQAAPPPPPQAASPPPPPVEAAPPAQPSVEAQLDELRTAQERTRDELTRIGDALARVQADLAELRAAPPVAPVAEPEAEPASEPEQPAEPAAVELGHLRFVLAGAAYRLDANEGPAPVVGETLALDERTFRVVKVGRSPLPGDERRCAYLLGD